MKNLQLWNFTAHDEESEILARAEQILSSRIKEQASVMSSPATVRSFFRTRLAARDREFFSVMLLDTKLRLIDVQELHAGSISSAEVSPRTVLRYALLNNASSVILAHNHPAGDPEPSAADRAITTRIKQALSLIDIRLLDHIVVGVEGTISLAERGWV